ncbi:MAG: DUF4364 family protein [Clostridia bacterium]|nr:DUF4364 family protein [Clostridia bacterium]
MRLKDKKDIKTFILYLMSQIDRPVDIGTLNDIVVQDDYVNQFDFMDSLYELCKSKAIEKTPTENGDIYTITPKGGMVVESFRSDLTPSMRERSVLSAMKLLSFSRRGARSSSRVEKDGDEYKLTCCVTDNNGKSMEVFLRVPTIGQANKMKANFDLKPEFIYRGMLALLSGDVDYLAESWAQTDDN